MSTALANPPTSVQNDQRIVLHGISWDEYLKLDEILGGEDNHHARLTYLDGALEIMTHGRRHEVTSRFIAGLLQAYFVEKRIFFIPCGSTTLREEHKRDAGGEPDESFCIGEDKRIPDLAVEVKITGGGIEKLEFYRRIGVPEVWIWENDALSIFRLTEKGYTKEPGSVILPDLNPNLLSRCIRIPSLLDAVQALLDGMKAK